MAKTLTLTLDDDVFQIFSNAAAAENRPLDNLVQTAALERIREREFVDEDEMVAILSDEDLLQRLSQGSRDARMQRGRFVE